MSFKSMFIDIKKLMVFSLIYHWQIKKIKAKGNKGKINQIDRCDKTISVKLNDPAHKTTGKIIDSSTLTLQNEEK